MSGKYSLHSINFVRLSRIMNLFIVYLLVVSWYIPKFQTYTLVVEKSGNCGTGTVRSIINVQYNYSQHNNDGKGYMEYLRTMNWEDNFEISADIYQKLDGRWVKNHQRTWPKTTFCIFLLADMVAIPIMQKFTNFEGRCPVKKGKFEVRTGKVVSKYQPLLPYGCWKAVVHFEKPDTGEVESICVILHSIGKLISNHTTCPL